MRIRIAGATLGDVMRALRAIAIVSLLLAAGPAAAQGLPGGRPPDDDLTLLVAEFSGA